MSYAGPLFGAVVAAVKAAQGGTMSYVQRVYVATVPTVDTGFPLVAIRLPPDKPYDSARWAGSGNRKESIFQVEVSVVAKITTDQSVANPYGDNTTPGILTYADDLQNVIDNARTAFLAAAPVLVDYETTTAYFQPEAPSDVASVTVLISFKLRYTAGSR